MAIKIQGDNATSAPGVSNSSGITGMSVQDAGATVSVYGTPTAKFATNGVYLAESGGPTIRFLNGDSPDKTLGGDAASDYSITSTGGKLEFRKADTTLNHPVLELAGGDQSTTKFYSNEYKFYEGSNSTNIAEGNYVGLNPRSDSADPDGAVFKYVKPNEYGGQPVCSLSDEGTLATRYRLYIGQQRSDSETVPATYPNVASTFGLLRGIADNTGYQQYFKLYCRQTTDNGDYDFLSYYNNGGNSTTAANTSNSTSSNKRWCVKQNGMHQTAAVQYNGRVEGDAGSPVSKYYSGRNGYYGYESSSTALLYMLPEAGGSSSTYFLFGRTSNNDTQFKNRTSDGRFYVDASGYTSGGADYAEHFEWVDGNPNQEDRVGISVVLEGDKIRPATASDNTSVIIGIISAMPAVLGDATDDTWHSKNLKDEFGRYIKTETKYLVWNNGKDNPQPNPNSKKDMENNSDHQLDCDRIPEALAEGHVPQWAIDNNIVMTGWRMTPNPDYDPNVEYVPREERPEWDPVGLMGKLWLKPNQPVGDRWIKLKDGSNGLTYWLVR